MRPRPPAEPKPFFWIPVREKPARSSVPDDVPGHDRFTGASGRLDLHLEVMSDYLYVGSGQFEFKTIGGRPQAHYAFARRDGQLVIPGSSLKGAVRAVLEAISNSCIGQRGRNESVPSSHHPCPSDGPFCPACRLFGTIRRRGRVHFSDAMPVGEVSGEVIKIADLWPPRQVGGRKFYRSLQFKKLDLKPAKNHRFLEAVPKGSKFYTVLYFENASPAEMGLLIRALGLDRSSNDPGKIAYVVPIKLGGAKPRCLGNVRFTPNDLRLLQDGPMLLTSLLGGGVQTPLTETLLRWLEEESLLDRRAWEQFRRNAKSEEEFCPEGVY